VKLSLITDKETLSNMLQFELQTVCSMSSGQPACSEHHQSDLGFYSSTCGTFKYPYRGSSRRRPFSYCGILLVHAADFGCSECGKKSSIMSMCEVEM
jgi:hypothetical protein